MVHNNLYTVVGRPEGGDKYNAGTGQIVTIIQSWVDIMWIICILQAKGSY